MPAAKAKMIRCCGRRKKELETGFVLQRPTNSSGAVQIPGYRVPEVDGRREVTALLQALEGRHHWDARPIG